MVSGREKKAAASSNERLVESREIDTPVMRWSELTVSTRLQVFPLLRDRLASTIEEFELQGTTANTQVAMAIEEALANAFYHGNLELDSQLKEDGSNRFTELAAEREKKEPWNQRKVFVSELATPFGLWITIRDEGEGFDVRKFLRQSHDPLAMMASGRGLILMKAFADDLIFNSKGNEVTLVFYGGNNEDPRKLLSQRHGSRSAELLTSAERAKS